VARRREASMSYVTFSLVLLAIGIYGLLTKRNIVKTLIAVELIASAASINFVAFASVRGEALGHTFMLLTLAVDSCVTGVALALATSIYRQLKIADLDKLRRLKG
jgi:NADH-quinone oxidoreductase subunit K